VLSVVALRADEAVLARRHEKAMTKRARCIELSDERATDQARFRRQANLESVNVPCQR